MDKPKAKKKERCEVCGEARPVRYFDGLLTCHECEVRAVDRLDDRARQGLGIPNESERSE